MASATGQSDKKMASVSMEDGKWSEKKMGGDGGLRTVECLRGRLLAERQASRLATENAELLDKKLTELENQIKEETNLRKKAEKKLKILIKKLESLSISATSVEADQSSSSEKCEVSRRSSTSTSGSKDPEDDETKSQATSPVISQSPDHNVSETSTSTPSHPSHPSHSSEKDPCPQGTAISQSNSNHNNPSQERFSDKFSSSSEDPKSDCLSCSSLKSSLQDTESNHEDNVDNSLALILVENKSNHEDNVDDSLALVPVSFPTTSRTAEMKPLNESVSEVLDALRHARERLQSSMQSRRHMVQVGPA